MNDKQGWSFRKRSSRQRVLSNTVITEISSPGNKECFDTASINFQQPTNGSIIEKDVSLQCASEKSQLPSTKNLKEYEAVDVIQKENKVDIGLEERSVIIIQTVIRGLLVCSISQMFRSYIITALFPCCPFIYELLLQARRELLKLKNVVKLQAAIRGHLVRKQAVETLRCIQAVIKLQSIVRARCARLALEQSHSEEPDVERTKDGNNFKTLVTHLIQI